MTTTPLAWFLTFHPYGLWLPGDARGWTPRASKRRECQHRLPPSAGLEAYARSRMRQPALYLDLAQCEVVADAFVAECSFRAWALHAISVQRDHVHVVISAHVDGRTARGCLKQRATRQLKARGLVAADRLVWAEGGSIRQVFTAKQLTRVIHYVDSQTR